MPTLHISRIRLMAIETFKILHKMTPLYLQDLVSHKTCAYSFRYDNLIDLPRVRTTKYGKSSFCYEAAAVWNSLPNELRKVEDFNEPINNSDSKSYTLNVSNEIPANNSTCFSSPDMPSNSTELTFVSKG